MRITERSISINNYICNRALLFENVHPDTSNSYDNAMIKRAIDWAKNRYSLSPVRTSNGGYEIGVVRKDYSPANMRVYTIKKNKQ